MSRRRGPRRIYHRGRRGGRSLWSWLQIIGMASALLAIVGYMIYLFWFKQPASSAAESLIMYLPLVVR